MLSKPEHQCLTSRKVVCSGDGLVGKVGRSSYQSVGPWVPRLLLETFGRTLASRGALLSHLLSRFPMWVQQLSELRSV